MKLLVLAGGLGKRLRSAVSNIPKALAPVGNVPFLQLQINQWIAQGLNEFTFLLHHQPDQIIDFLKVMSTRNHNEYRIDWLVEPSPLDTGGAIAHAVDKLGLIEDFLVINADTWLGGGVNELIKSVSPTIAVLNLPNVSRYGQVYFDQYNHVTAFVEKNDHSSAGWINAGLCRLSPFLFKDWNGLPFSLEKEFFASLAESKKLKVVQLQTDFIDIGVPKDYYRFCRWVEKGCKTTL
jgi:D-glycero-alpha-D-manno-heptose 1-phosphate guanylyltransferase